MVPWELLDSVSIPGSGEKLSLYRRGEEYSIRVDRIELMNSRAHGSEEALAETACGRIAGRSAPRVLIGGLGMGFTAAAALRSLGENAEVIVGEIVPAVAEWNREFLSHLAGHPLKDKRTGIIIDDIAEIIKNSPGLYDAIMLDVDNSPRGMSRKGNQQLYTEAGTRAIFRALTPGGVYALWSMESDRAYSRLLMKCGFSVEEKKKRGRKAGKGAHHTIWLASRER